MVDMQHGREGHAHLRPSLAQPANVTTGTSVKLHPGTTFQDRPKEMRAMLTALSHKPHVGNQAAFFLNFFNVSNIAVTKHLLKHYYLS